MAPRPKNKDNGVLLVAAIKDRKMRIEVGKGLEGVLTDALSSQIIRNEIAAEIQTRRLWRRPMGGRECDR